MPIEQADSTPRQATEQSQGLNTERGRTWKVLIIGLVILCSAVRMKAAYTRAATPFELEYEEGNILNAGFRILHGLSPYPAAGSYPYVFNPYGPVAYLLSAIALKFLGISLWGPRVLVLAAGFGIAVLVGLIASSLGARIEVSCLLGLFYLCSPVMWQWLPLLRVDLWAIFLTLLGLYFFQKHGRSWMLISSVVLGLALLTKHTTIAAPAACMFELILQRRWLRALGFSVSTGAVVAIGIALATLTGTPLFHLLRTHPDPYSFVRLFVAYAIAIGWACLILGILVYASVFSFRPKPETRLVWSYFGLCCITSFTAGKLGSNTNHFLEWTAAASIIAALSLNHLLDIHDPLAHSFVLGLGALCVTLVVVPTLGSGPSSDQAECVQAYAFVRDFHGQHVLSEDVSGLLLNGKPVLVSNPFVVTQLGSSVVWSKGSVEDLVEHRYFDLVILGHEPHVTGRWSPVLKDALEKNYKLESQFQCLPYMASALVPK